MPANIAMSPGLCYSLDTFAQVPATAPTAPLFDGTWILPDLEPV